MDKIIFSIVVPCYNIDKYIGDTIESILKQTFLEYEVILIDDGSGDETLNILEKYQKIDSRIKVISQNNCGVSSARNKGISIAKGKYIYISDGDDTLEHDLLEEAYNHFEKNSEINCFAFSYRWVKKNGKVLKEYISKTKDEGIYSRDDFFSEVLKFKIPQSIVSLIVEREVLESNNIKFKEDVKYGEDIEFIFNVFMSISKVYYSKKILYNYIQRKNSAINREITLSRIEDPFKIYHRLKEKVSKSGENKISINFERYLVFVYFYLLRITLKKVIKKENLLSYFEIFKNNEYILRDYKGKNIILKIIIKLYLLFPNMYYRILKNI